MFFQYILLKKQTTLLFSTLIDYKKQTWENYVHICKRVRNLLVKIYDAYKMYLHVTHLMNKLFLSFVWLICLPFWILTYRLFTQARRNEKKFWKLEVNQKMLENTQKYLIG